MKFSHDQCIVLKKVDKFLILNPVTSLHIFQIPGIRFTCSLVSEWKDAVCCKTKFISLGSRSSLAKFGHDMIREEFKNGKVIIRILMKD